MVWPHESQYIVVSGLLSADRTPIIDRALIVSALLTATAIRNPARHSLACISFLQFIKAARLL